MKASIITLVLLLLTASALAQEIEITGTVKDTTHVIAFANVIVKNQNDELTTGTITNKNGAFNLSVKPGKYILTIKYMGYEPYHKKISASKDIYLKIPIVKQYNSLDAVVLTSKRPTLVRKNDRLIFNIENTTTAGAGSAVNVLGVTPGIILINDKFTMLGKSSMKVMINGRILPFTGDQLFSYLNSIPSNTIKNVEVITTPPSKYSAEGNAGLINIILKENKNDYWNSSVRLSGTQRHYSSWSGGTTFNYKKNKLSLSANIGVGVYNKRNLFRNKTFYPDQTWKGDGTNHYNNKFLNSSISADYELFKFWRTGINYSNTFSHADNRSKNLDKVFNTNGELEFSIKSNGKLESRFKSHAVNFYNILKLDSLGKKISIDLDYYKAISEKNGRNGGIKLDQNDVIIENPLFSNQTSIDYDFDNFSAKIDVYLPLKQFDLQFGASSNLSKTVNNFDFYNSITGEAIFDPNQSNKFEYEENIFALYTSGDLNLTEKWSVKAGLRMEKTWTTSYSKSIGQVNETEYLKFFPTFYSTYKFNNDYSISANYSRRLNRPQFSMLDPFKIVINPFKIVQGNPFLKPSYSNNFELIFNSKKNQLKGYYQHTTGGYDQIAQIDPATKIMKYNYLNYLDIQNYGLTDTYIYDKLDWLTSYNTIDIGYSIMRSSIPQTINKQEGFNSMVQTRNDIALNSNETLLLGLNAYYLFPRKFNLSETEGFGALNLSLKLKLMDKKLNLYLFLNDVLNSSKRLVTSYYNGIKSTYKNYYDTKSIRLRLVYSFGNNKISTKHRKAGNEDIKNRAGN